MDEQTATKASAMKRELDDAGWYLMMPPLLGEGRVDLDAPFSSWMQLQAFDSVSRCENERILWTMLARANDDASIERAAQHFMFSTSARLRPTEHQGSNPHPKE